MAAFRPMIAPLERPIRIAALISGGGTTVLNIQQQIDSGDLNAEIVRVIASRPDCTGIEKARNAGLDVEVVARKNFSSTAAFSAAIFRSIEESRADLVTLAGFLSLIEIPEAFRCRVMNVHPSLIPAFCGKGFHGRHVHEAVLARGAKVSGCTVHFADNEYDHGPIIVQRTVPVLDDDTPDTLATRVFEAECEAYPEAIRQFASAELEIEGRRVRRRPTNREPD
jgi:formyltetrahydrofolate-dependent phosphoribosylglycinamide formyltransferase